MPSIFHSLLLFSVFSASFSRGIAAESAWNGRVTPEASTPAAFTPYYVPPGAKSYDSSSPLIQYSGKWTDSFSSMYVQNSIRSTAVANASVSFTFLGTGIEWFGNTGKFHGTSRVYIDGVFVQLVDAWSATLRRKQRIFWNFDLTYGKHTLKIFNTPEAQRYTLDIDAFVVTKGQNPQDFYRTHPSSVSTTELADVQSHSTPLWTLTQRGSTGVHAMQLTIISNTHAIIIDKVEHNPLTFSGHPAWAALYNLRTDALTPLSMQSNSFCAGGTFLANGSLIIVGGNPVVDDHTSSADFGDLDGLQAIRLFEPCDSNSVEDCGIYENHGRIRLGTPRWYNTVLRIADGSAMIIGGSKKGGWINNSTVNNPTIEFFPPKAIHGSNGLPIHLPFLANTLNSNLFPIAFSLPDGRIFIAANNDAMIYDWLKNIELRLPQIPNGVRVTYPMAGTGLLLPLSPDNNYVPEVLLCGGSTVDDTRPGYQISSQEPASAQCSRIVLSDEGIAAGWHVEEMPQARIMPDAVLLPTGDVFIVNGAGTGISGYGNVLDQVGASNADYPVFTPVLYDPLASAGQRFSSHGMPTSQIPRLYHSVATLTPNGDIMVAGSNPNLDRSEIEYGTEYRVEWFGPPYMQGDRPIIASESPKTCDFGQTRQLTLEWSSSFGPAPEVKVSLMDLGYVTHAVHANSRLVYLKSSLDGNTLTINGPPNGNIYPPGPGWLYVVVNGIPSIGMKVMVGDGAGPAVDPDAIENLLRKTAVDQYEKSKKGKN